MGKGDKAQQAAMDADERKELVEELLQALDAHGVSGEGGHLLELIRAEQHLISALALIRRQIDAIVKSVRPDSD